MDGPEPDCEIAIYPVVERLFEKLLGASLSACSRKPSPGVLELVSGDQRGAQCCAAISVYLIGGGKCGAEIGAQPRCFSEFPGLGKVVLDGLEKIGIRRVVLERVNEVLVGTFRVED